MLSNLKEKLVERVERLSNSTSRQTSRPPTPTSRPNTLTLQQQQSLSQSIEELTAALSNHATAKPPFKVFVGTPELRSGRLSDHHEYPIRCEPSITLDPVYRRYSDFEWLRKSLRLLYPGLFISNLPPKKLLGNKDESFVENRRAGLQHFLNRLAAQPYMNQEAVFKVFLACTTSFDEEMKSINKDINETKIAQVSHRYSQLFPTFQSTPLTLHNDLDLRNVEYYIKECQNALSALDNSVSSQCQLSAANLQQWHAFNVGFNQLLEIENTVPLYPTTATTATLSTHRVNLSTAFYSLYKSMQQQHNTLEQRLLTLVRNQLADVEAMSDVLKQRNEQESLYKRAHKHAQKWRRFSISDGNGQSVLADVSVKSERDAAQRAMDLLAEREEKDLLDWQTKFILWLNLPLFIQTQSTQFNQLINQYAIEMLQHCKTLQHNWQQIVNQTNDIQIDKTHE